VGIGRAEFDANCGIRSGYRHNRKGESRTGRSVPAAEITWPKGKLEERIDQLRQLRVVGAVAGVEEILRKALSDRSNLIVAEAARTAGELGVAGCIPHLLTSFEPVF
jgi:hypothetical protein